MATMLLASHFFSKISCETNRKIEQFYMESCHNIFEHEFKNVVSFNGKTLTFSWYAIKKIMNTATWIFLIVEIQIYKRGFFFNRFLFSEKWLMNFLKLMVFRMAAAKDVLLYLLKMI